MSAQPGGVLIASTGASQSGSLALSQPNAVFAAPTNGGLRVNNLPIVTADSGANAYICSQAGTTACSIGQSGSVVGLATALLLKQLTVATLPACTGTSRGQIYEVTDLSAAPTYRQTGLAGGGGVQGLVMCNGTAWESH